MAPSLREAGLGVTTHRLRLVSDGCCPRSDLSRSKRQGPEGGFVCDLREVGTPVREATAVQGCVAQLASEGLMIYRSVGFPETTRRADCRGFFFRGAAPYAAFRRVADLSGNSN